MSHVFDKTYLSDFFLIEHPVYYAFFCFYAKFTGEFIKFTMFADC